MEQRLIAFLVLLLICSCGQQKEQSAKKMNPYQPQAKLADSLVGEGYEVFKYVDERSGDTILMQQYFMVFLKRGTAVNRDTTNLDSLQRLHLAHLQRMYDEGYSSLAGPFGGDTEMRGIVIYNTPDQKMADSLARLDPMVKSGWLEVEILPWWAGKGFPLR